MDEILIEVMYVPMVNLIVMPVIIVISVANKCVNSRMKESQHLKTNNNSHLFVGHFMLGEGTWGMAV